MADSVSDIRWVNLASNMRPTNVPIDNNKIETFLGSDRYLQRKGVR